MPNEKELQLFIFELLEMQIMFGVHRYGDTLPTIKEASTYFLASVDTVRLAYLRLKQRGYITLSTCVGAAVKVRYSNEEIQRHIEHYFSRRRKPMRIFVRSVGALANYTQWFALKHASPGTLDKLESLCSQNDIAPIYRMSRLLQLIYSPLGNDLLLRLLWKLFLYFQAPFISIPRNLEAANGDFPPLLRMIQMVRDKDWPELWNAGEANNERFYAALFRFIDDSIPQSGCEQIYFAWSIYKKTSQVCYSLCMDILTEIQKGVYPVGSFLPSPQKLAREKQVSIHTIRRTILLLNKLGAVQSVNGVGTKVLPLSGSAQNCDLQDPTIRKRLLEFLKCLHILSFTCRSCVQITIRSMDAGSVRQLINRLEEVKHSENYGSLLYASYEMISPQIPYPAVRTVYTELTHQFFWAFPLQGLHGNQKQTNAHFLPYIEALIESLARSDADAVSKILEELLIDETRLIAQHLNGLGITEAASIVLREKEGEPCS